MGRHLIANYKLERETEDDDVRLVVEGEVCGAEPDVGIMSDYVELTRWTPKVKLTEAEVVEIEDYLCGFLE